MKLTIETIVDNLEPGEYKATIRVSVPDSFLQTVEIPVVLVVTDPPAPEPGA
jgi:hypothetical protein